MNIYVPTYLYIKQHSITGLKYFGKTVKDPLKYLGSGTYWKRHIKKHKTEYIITLWYHQFDTQDLLTEFALLFSEEYDIVNSGDWANLIPENGVSGSPKGLIKTKEHIKKISMSNTGKKRSPEFCAKLSKSQSGITRSPRSSETKNKISKSNTGKKRTHLQNEAMSKRQTGKKIAACSAEKKLLLANINAKPFSVVDYSGKLHTGNNLKLFCKENNLKYGSMWLVLSCKQKTHNGWTNISSR